MASSPSQTKDTQVEALEQLNENMMKVEISNSAQSCPSASKQTPLNGATNNKTNMYMATASFTTACTELTLANFAKHGRHGFSPRFFAKLMTASPNKAPHQLHVLYVHGSTNIDTKWTCGSRRHQLHHVDSWLLQDQTRCYSLIQASNRVFFNTWTTYWGALGVVIEVNEVCNQPAPTSARKNQRSPRKTNQHSSGTTMQTPSTTKHRKSSPNSSNSKRRSNKRSNKKSSPNKHKPHYSDPNNGRDFYVGGVLVVTEHPLHGPSLLVFHNPTRFNPQDKTKHGGWESPQGKFETSHATILETCRAELFEETAGLIDVTSHCLQHCPFIDLPNSPVVDRNSYKRFYLLRIDGEHNLVQPHDTFSKNHHLLTALSQQKDMVQSGSCSCYLEMDKVAFLPLSELKTSEVGFTEPVCLKTWDSNSGGGRKGACSVVNGYRGDMKEPMECLLWLLKATLVARSLDETGEPRGMTGLEFACSAFESDGTKSASDLQEVSFGQCERTLGSTDLGSLGLCSVAVKRRQSNNE